jgi:hypothetical protein
MMLHGLVNKKVWKIWVKCLMWITCEFTENVIINFPNGSYFASSFQSVVQNLTLAGISTVYTMPGVSFPANGTFYINSSDTGLNT